jgi:hypothetical protein
MKRTPLLALLAACFAHGPSDQGITSQTHRSHVGGMVFSHQVIPHGQENPGAFVDHCVLGEGCYGRFYLKSSLRDSAHADYAAGIALHAIVDGRPAPDGIFSMEAYWSTYNFTLFRAPNDAQAWEHPKWFLSKAASQLAPGDHVIELQVLAIQPYQGAGSGKPIAAGRITMTVPEGSDRMIASWLAREDQLAAGARAQQQAAQAELDRPEPAHIKLTNDCDHGVTFLFTGQCGEKRIPVAGGQTGSVSFPDIRYKTCEVCIAGPGGCKYMATMVTGSTTEARVSSGGGCDSPALN